MKKFILLVNPFPAASFPPPPRKTARRREEVRIIATKRRQSSGISIVDAGVDQ